MKTTLIDLVTDNGEIVRIKCPTEHEDACFDSIENTMKTRGWFSVSQWDGCSATYLGMIVPRVNMGKIIATL